MARVRSPNRDKAFKIYKEHNGDIDLVKIAESLEVSPGTVRGWKNKDAWEEKLKVTFQINKERSKKNKGGQPGNKNATGPPGNKHAEKFGFFSKYLPEETMELIEEIQTKDKLDILWEQISIQYAAIIRAQRIMFVTDKKEMIKELKKHKSSEMGEEVEYEFQFAWDRQASFLNAQSRAMGELRSLIKQYDNMINSNFELASEEQKLRIQKLKAEIGKLNSDDLDNELHITIDYGDD
ncbi:phage terminase small subunit [Terrisporobacter petrolearius]|uniref:phage terminase small subunit n=1 Tax=Terrisporobacter petrolearius TaxID=1460447 RepID=UPI003B0088CA